jgi:hypothetical protein
VFPNIVHLAVLAGSLALAGCDAPASPPLADAAGADSGYLPPPSVLQATAGAEGVVLSGAAQAGSPVRLAEPGGEARTVTADGGGRWAVRLPAAAEARIFGLSAPVEGRRVQAEGYLLVGPKGQAALLRAGGAALRLDAPERARIAALDFDAEGGGLLSGFAAAGTDVAVRLDGRPAGDARADADGRFTIGLPRLSSGSHRIEATGVGLNSTVLCDSSPAAPLAAGPLRSQLTQGGLRADWLTPGGGVQSTFLAD